MARTVSKRKGNEVKDENEPYRKTKRFNGSNESTV